MISVITEKWLIKYPFIDLSIDRSNSLRASRFGPVDFDNRSKYTGFCQITNDQVKQLAWQHYLGWSLSAAAI